MILQARYAWVAAVSFTAALLLASLRLRDCRWCSAQVSHRDWPGIAGLLQFRHGPSSLALSRFFCSWRRWYSFRSGCWLLTCSYSRRAFLAVSGSLALVAEGLFPSPLGFGLGSFFLARLVCLGPARGLPGIGKVCWNKILLGESAGSAPGPRSRRGRKGVHPRSRGVCSEISYRAPANYGPLRWPGRTSRDCHPPSGGAGQGPRCSLGGSGRQSVQHEPL